MWSGEDNQFEWAWYLYLQGLLVNSDKKLVNTLGSSAIVSLLYQGFNLMNQTLQMQRWLHSRRYY